MSRKKHSKPQPTLKQQLFDQLIEAYLLLIYYAQYHIDQFNGLEESQADTSETLDSVLEILENRGLITRPENQINLTKDGKLAAELFLTLKSNVFFNENTFINWWDEKTRFIKSFPRNPKRRVEREDDKKREFLSEVNVDGKIEL